MSEAGVNAIRFGQITDLDDYLRGWAPANDIISPTSALEETFFLGLRLTRGVRLADVEAEFGVEQVAELRGVIAEVIGDRLATLREGVMRLTPRGRLLSNEVFEKFVSIGTIDDLPELMEFIRRTRPPESDKIQ